MAPTPLAPLLGRSVRTLAWVGDAVFEQQVRVRVALRGDYPVDRLDAIKAAVVRAEQQAALLERIADALDDDEQALVRRAKNTAPPSSARGRRGMQSYRAASALEALVARWAASEAGVARMLALLMPHVDAAIDDALASKARRPRRG